MPTWKKTDIVVDGVPQKALTPIIVSASRCTDIPAFYADWFFERMKLGYSAWTNPFNGVRSYVSYKDTRFIVFWSKNPSPLLEYLHVLDEMSIKCYIQFTLNDYEAEGFETVPPLCERIETFKLLVARLGFGSVVWRFDPLLLTDEISVDVLLERIRKIGDELKGYTQKLVFSFADIAPYRKVKKNLEKSGVCYREWTEDQMEDFAARLSSMNVDRGWNYVLSTCGEKIDLAKCSISHNRCIDGDLITQLAWEDKALMDFLHVKIMDVPSPTLFGDIQLPKDAIRLSTDKYFISQHKKDSGQRTYCGCMMAKDIGEYNTCPHSCVYCYANSSNELASNNYERHLLYPHGDTITGGTM